MNATEAKPGNGTPTSPRPQTVASASASPNPDGVGNRSDAVAAVAKHGGTPSGKTGVAGTVPGTPEHVLAKRDVERVRKADYRARQRATNPPTLPAALPSALPGASGEVAPVGSGAAPVPGALLVPWNAEPLRPLFEGLVSTAEQLTVAKQTGKAAKAKLPAAILKEIEAKARWNPLQKTSLVSTGPQVCADAMNDAGINGKYQPLTIFALTVASVWLFNSMNAADLDRLIAEHQKATEEKK